MTDVWKEFPLEFGGYKLSADEARIIAHEFRRRCIAECLADYYNVDGEKLMELADRVIEVQNECWEVITEDDAIRMVAEEEGLEIVEADDWKEG